MEETEILEFPDYDPNIASGPGAAGESEMDGGAGDADLERLIRQLARTVDSQYQELNALLKGAGKPATDGRQILFYALNRVYEGLQSLIPCERLGLSLLDDGGTLVKAVWARSAATETLLTEGYSAPLAGSSLETIAKSGWPRIIHDLQLYLEQHPGSDSTRIIVEEGMLSNLTCPLQVMGKPIGFLFFTSMTVNAYTAAHVRAFMLIAARLGAIIEKARLYEGLLDFDASAHNLLYPAGEEPASTKTLHSRTIRKILCADADEVVRMLLSNVLSGEGYEVGVFRDGMQVLDKFAKEPCDLIVVGGEMPGLSGFEVCSRLRTDYRNKGVPVILLLNDDSREAVGQSIDCGADDVIFKPLRPLELLGKIALLTQKGDRGASVDMRTTPGSVFAGKYRIVQKIGFGGYSTIFYAINVSSEPQRPVALKVVDLPLSKIHDQRYLSRLLREGYQHSRLTHPNIVQLHDFGQVGGIYFLAMEYVAGLSLTEIVEDTGPVPEDTLVLVGLEAVKALRYLDDANLVHRDIKAANLMITTDGDVKLLDFGLTKRRDETTMSTDDEFHGTPRYSAPEHILGHSDLDIRSDVYSLGVTLYYAASGTYPFVGASAIDVFRRHLDSKPESLQDRAEAAISQEFSDLIGWMLEKEKDERPRPQDAQRILTRLFKTLNPE